MKTLAKYTAGFTRMVRLERKQPSAPEPLEQESLPMVGLLSQLTPEQKERALSYRGSENVGGAEFRLGKVDA